jgi:hypothetical protein
VAGVPNTGAKPRLPVATVELLHRHLAGDPRTEAQVLVFIGARYGAASLLYLPPGVAAEICRRPADFLRAVRRHVEPDLGL